MNMLNGPEPNLLDKAIAWLNPGWGESRMQARHIWHANRIRSHLLSREAESIERKMDRRDAAEARYFPGSEFDDRTSFGNQLLNHTPNEGMLVDLRTMQTRSRFLAFDDDYFSGAVEGCIYQVIGKPWKFRSLARECPAQFGIPAITPRQADDCRTVLEQTWKEQECDVMLDGTSFNEGLEQVLWHELVDGSGPLLISDVDRRGRPTSLTLQALDPWLIQRPLTSGNFDDDNLLGIETKDGVPVRVHFLKNFRTAEMTWVEAERMPIAFRPRWAGQQLGLPWIFAGDGRCHDRKVASEATIISYQIASCFSMFISTEAQDFGRGNEEVPDSKGQGMRRFKNLRPGQIIVGRPGESATPIKPGQPGSSYSPFMEVNLRGTGAGINYPYEYLSNDFSKTTYLSGRMSQILGREMFGRRQRMLVVRTCEPVWCAHSSRVAVKGLLPISARQFAANRRAICRVKVQPRGWMWIDPPKDIAAAIDAIGHGVGSYHSYFESQGEDAEEQFDLQESEREMRAERKLPDPFAVPPPGTLEGQTAPAKPGAAPGARAATPRKTPVPAREPLNPDDYPEDDE